MEWNLSHGMLVKTDIPTTNLMTTKCKKCQLNNLGYVLDPLLRPQLRKHIAPAFIGQCAGRAP